MKKYVADTSVIIEKTITKKLLPENKISGTLLIPHAVISELENQANKGLEIGFIGLEEIQEIRKSKKLKIEFAGQRPTETQIKLAKSGEIDAYIREIASKENAILITADKVQAESGKAFDLETMYVEPKRSKEVLEIEKFFDDKTMSVHLKEKCNPLAKRGFPGAWKLEKISNETLSFDSMEHMAKEIVEKSRTDPDTFVEIERRGVTIVQYKNYRIVMVKPPISDGFEITAVHPIKKLNIEDYELPQSLLNRIKEKAKGVIITGETGSGKSTFTQALAELYMKSGKVVKTVESPRDLQLPDEITQYSKNFTSSESMHDILFLSRPDCIVFDEMRDTPDFELFSDLRLGASEVIGVVHASSPIDAVQRFISRLEVGMIPSILDTIIYIAAGKISEVHALNMVVKVPTGMTESDLARPIVEVRDFNTSKLKYEIYSYGEETVVIPVGESTKSGAKQLAAKEIERELRKYTSKVKAELVSDSRAIVYVPEKDIAYIIGKQGSMIEQIEKDLGISIEVKELEESKGSIDFTIQEQDKNIVIYTEPGINVDVYVNEKFLFNAISSKKGEIKMHKKSNTGRELLRAISKKHKIEVKT